MRVTEHRDGNRERQILIGMITDSTVLGRIASKWSYDLFSSTWANTISQWCKDYYETYREAPRKAIVGLFASWAEKGSDKETIRLVETFLESINEEYEQNEQPKPEYVSDLAGKHFNAVKVNKLITTVQGDMDAGEVQDAINRLADYRKIELGVGAAIDLFQDQQRIAEMFAVEEHNTLISYPGSLGDFFGTALEEESFIAFQGPEKSGKSMWLLDIAWRAMCQRKRVAFFEVGDMTEKQVFRRFLIRASAHPLRSPSRQWPCVLQWPKAIRATYGENAEVDFEERRYKGPLDHKKALRAVEEVMQHRVKSNHSYLRFSVHPNSSINVAGIREILKSWEVDGWVPHVVIVDYSDILASPDGKMEMRDQINTTWKQLRALSQELHCLVVTATQADAESYRKETQDRKNFSEDKRKLSHVTGLVGINVTSAEKERGVCRLNWIVLREGDFSPRRCVHVAGCLALANPAVRSCFPVAKKKTSDEE